MRERILKTWTREKLDQFLKGACGHGYAYFELSFLSIYILFQYLNVRAKSYPMIQKERQRLSKLRRQLIEIFDEYLNGIEFYSNSPSSEVLKQAGFTEWNSENRNIFIQKYFKLEPTLAIIEKPDDWFLKVEMEDDIIPYAYGIDKGLRISPLSLLILVWTNVFKRKSRVDWISLNGLLLWLSEVNEWPRLNRFYGLVKGKEIGEDILRLTRNKYRQSRYNKTALVQFRAIFIEIPQELLNGKLEEFKWWVDSELLKSPEQYSKNQARFFCKAALFPEIFRPIYDLLSTESLEPREESEEETDKIERLRAFIRSQYR